MDFGFATFLEKFEEKFGSFACKALLLLIAGGVCAVCISLLMNNIVIPAYNIVAEYFDDEQSLTFRHASNTLFTIIFFIWGMNYIVTAFRKKMELREVEGYKDDYQEYAASAAEFFALNEIHLERVAQINGLLIGRLTAKKRDEIAELAGEMQVELVTRRTEIAEKIRNLNARVEQRNGSDTQKPDMTGYNPDTVTRGPEDTDL